MPKSTLPITSILTCCLVLLSLGGNAGRKKSTLRGAWSCLRVCCPRPWRTYVQGGCWSSALLCFTEYLCTPWGKVWRTGLRVFWGCPADLGKEARISGKKWHHTTQCPQGWVAKPDSFCRRWRHGQSRQRLEETLKKMEILAFHRPVFPFRSQRACRKAFATLFPSSGRPSSFRQAPHPAWSRPHLSESLRSAPCLTQTAQSKLRIVARRKTSTNEPHRLKAVLFHRPLVLGHRPSSKSNLCSYLTAVRKAPVTRHNNGCYPEGPRQKIMTTVREEKTRISSQERSVGDTVSMTMTAWKKLSPW